MTCIFIYDALSYLSTDACRRNLISTNFLSYRFVTNHKKRFNNLVMLSKMKLDILQKDAIKFHFTDAGLYSMACICIHVDPEFQESK